MTKKFYAIPLVSGLFLATASLAPVITSGPASAGDYGLAIDAAMKQDYKTAFREFKDLADSGMAAAQFNLALLYHHGRGIDVDIPMAVKYYAMAAEQGHSAAQNNLGSLYRRG